jgi:hypothetical protein
MATDAELDAALEELIVLSRAHLAAVRTGDEDTTWRAFVALNNATAAYEDLLTVIYGELTPWDVTPIGEDALDSAGEEPPSEIGETDGMTVVVRQRFDLTVRNLRGLLADATASRRATWSGVDDDLADEPVESATEAVAELLGTEKGPRPGLLERRSIVTVVAKTDEPLTAETIAQEGFSSEALMVMPLADDVQVLVEHPDLEQPDA